MCNSQTLIKKMSHFEKVKLQKFYCDFTRLFTIALLTAKLSDVIYLRMYSSAVRNPFSFDKLDNFLAFLIVRCKYKLSFFFDVYFFYHADVFSLFIN